MTQTTIAEMRVSGFVLLFFLWGMGCSSPDFAGPKVTDPAQLPWTLSLSARAITMSTAAPYDTLQLTVSPRTLSGDPLPGAVVTFTSRDSSVHVSPAGLITARAPKIGVLVIATVVHKGIRLADTAAVTVTTLTNPPVARQLRVQLLPGDSAKIAAPNPISEFIWYASSKGLVIGAVDSTGAHITNALVAYRISDPRQAKFRNFGGDGDANRISSFSGTSTVVDLQLSSRVGVPFTVHANATIYGVTLRDSLQLQVTDQLLFFYTLTKPTPVGSSTPVFTLSPPHQETVGIGALVIWVNATQDSLDIVFDDPTAASDDPFCGGNGNIAPFAPPPEGPGFLDCVSTMGRVFNRAGTFPFHSTRTGVSGKVIVQ